MENPVEPIHVIDKIPDYILSLLPAEEERVVVRHIAGCDRCRQAAMQERRIGQAVYNTLSTVARPDYGRLPSLMPPTPTQTPGILASLTLHGQWAIACLLLVAVMGAFLFNSGGYNRLAAPSSTRLVTTITYQAPSYTTRDAAGDAAGNAGTHFFTAAQPTESFNRPAENSSPAAAALPVAPQVTPAPAATYYH
jgi:anti-sigma factor RsiW